MVGPEHDNGWRWFSMALLAVACGASIDAAMRDGNAAAARGALTEARASYERAVIAAPGSARALTALAETQLALGEASAAASTWARVLELGDSNRALEALASIALDAADHQRAVELMARRRGPAPTVVEARVLLATNDPAGALSVAKTLNSPEARYLEASALIALHRFADAQAVLEALGQNNAGPLAPYGLARLAAAQERSADALLYLARAKSAWGDHFPGTRVATDPAFAFMADQHEFSELVRGPP